MQKVPAKSLAVKKTFPLPERDSFTHSEAVATANLTLLKAQKYCDVTFVVGQTKEIKCHKLFLMSRSPVFEAMFSERWDATDRVVLEDVEPSTFVLFLQFMYGDIFTESIPMAIKLLQLGDKYDVKPLVQKCVGLMSRGLQLKDAIQTFVTARMYSLETLMIQAGDMMASSFDQLSNESSFRDIDEETLIYLLKRNDLPLSECELFTVALRWASGKMEKSPHQNQNYAEVLKNIVPLIRFPLMTAQEFAMNVVPTQILSQKDIIEMFLYFNSDEIVRGDVARRIPFSAVPREAGEALQFDFYESDGSTQSGDFYGRTNTAYTHGYETLEYKDGHEVITEICYMDTSKRQLSVHPRKLEVAKLVSVLLQGLNYDRLRQYWPSGQAPEQSHNILVFIETEDEPGNSKTVHYTKSCLITKGTVSELKIRPSIQLTNRKKYHIRVQFQGSVLEIRESHRSTDMKYDMLTGTYLKPSLSKSGGGTLTMNILHPSEARHRNIRDNRVRGLHVVAGIKLIEL